VVPLLATLSHPNRVSGLHECTLNPEVGKEGMTMSRPVDIDTGAAARAESSNETRPAVPGVRVIAGVRVPDSPLINEALLHGKTLSEPYLFNHAVRSWLFAVRIGEAKRIDCDPEVVAVGTILHDIGLTTGVSGANRFEVNGAAAARAFVKDRGFSDRRAQLVWDLVALNSTVSIALHKEPEVALGTMGIGLDYGGFGFELIPSAEMTVILDAFPRLRMKDQFAETCCRLVKARPETSSDNFLRDFGDRFVPGYKPVSTVDLLTNAPFEE
jgi:hypothetical protein